MISILIIPRRQTREDLTLNRLRCGLFSVMFSTAAYADVYFNLYVVFLGKDCPTVERIVFNLYLFLHIRQV